MNISYIIQFKYKKKPYNMRWSKFLTEDDQSNKPHSDQCKRGVISTFSKKILIILYIGNLYTYVCIL